MNSMLRAKGLPEVDFRAWEERNAESVAQTGKELDRPQRHQGPEKTNAERKRRRRLARTKMEKDNELKKAKGELKKLESKSKSSSSIKSKIQVPTIGNLADETSSKVAANIAKKQDVTTVVSKRASKVSQQSVSTPEPKSKENKAQQPVHDIPVPIPKSVRQHVHSNAGPDHKCFICIPDGSDRCKYCKFREDELGEEHSSSHGR